MNETVSSKTEGRKPTIRLTLAQFETFQWISGNKSLMSYDFSRRRYSLKPVKKLEELGIIDVEVYNARQKTKCITINEKGSAFYDRLQKELTNLHIPGDPPHEERVKILMNVVNRIANESLAS